ncbi:uncharacterized protein LOC129824849 isoform X1 [Salvelinus fontinalis]|uniref:uncharacterized protein LOC129824849 isoform X1 n=1 Tax=Salvelinus fontinalis TaxID=8038 RepID=UPI002485B4A4|nr:uncharacterized protein LOC129824849 isoform X1 [Salvelinus fontinalis]XP_055740330.1 uncharacterized protein LOC129824849 isoform X1 [Salvelinus fontinalis]
MRGGSQQVVVRMHHVSRVRGLETQLVWAISKETARLSPKGIPYCATKVQSITWIQRVAGRVTHYASHLCHETSVDVTLGCYQQTDVSVVYATLHMGLDGLLSSSAWSEAASFSTPTTQQFTDPEPDGHNCYKGWEEDLLPEEREVPLLNLYLTTKRVEDIALRLVSLRQAFTTLLGSTLSRNHLFVAGKVLLGALVQANHMDGAKFIRTYNDFVDYLSDPSKRNDIERELAEAKIHHVNMIDVVFELVLFGMMTAQKSLRVHPGGFVEHLYALLYSFLPTAANMEPEADRYLLLLNVRVKRLLPVYFHILSVLPYLWLTRFQCHFRGSISNCFSPLDKLVTQSHFLCVVWCSLQGGLMALLDDMFGQQLAWYFNPESLVTELSSLLEYHLENLMASM